MKRSLKEIAINLRRKGFSYSFIQEKIPVSKSTLSSWLAGIEYVPNSKVLSRIGKARAASGAAKSFLKSNTIKEAMNEARRDIVTFTRRDLFMLGLGVYIGEGTKSHGIIRVINSDPKIVKLAIRWFREVCYVPLENFKVRLHVYPDVNSRDALKYWSKETRIPIGQFYPQSVDRRLNKTMARRGKLPYGTAHLSVTSRGDRKLGVFLFHKINSWISEVVK
jgi:hypothetical protein